MATVLIQAIVVLTMISLVYGKISGQILHDNLQLRTIKVRIFHCSVYSENRPLFNFVCIAISCFLYFCRVCPYCYRTNLQLMTKRNIRVYGVGMTVDAMREKNIISSVGVIIFLLYVMSKQKRLYETKHI